MNKSLLSIIIVNYNNPELIDSCLRAIDVFLIDVCKEVVVVDNNSTVQNLAYHEKRYAYLKIIYLPENMGFGFANNVGVKNASGNNLLLLNSDAEFVDNSFFNVLETFKRVRTPELWGLRLTWPDGRFQSSYSKEIGFFDYFFNYTFFYELLRGFDRVKSHKYYGCEFILPTQVDIVYATAILMRRVDYEKLGGFSRKYFMYFEDVDLCDRFRSDISGRIVYHPQATLVHKVKGSSNGKSFNFQYIKSQYVYGISKFGFFGVCIILPIDTCIRWVKSLLKNF